jgi:hypothetical protein
VQGRPWSARKNRNSSGSIEHNNMQLGRSMLQLDKLQRHRFDTPVGTTHISDAILDFSYRVL